MAAYFKRLTRSTNNFSRKMLLMAFNWFFSHFHLCQLLRDLTEKQGVVLLGCTWTFKFLHCKYFAITHKYCVYTRRVKRSSSFSSPLFLKHTPHPTASSHSVFFSSSHLNVFCHTSARSSSKTGNLIRTLSLE